VASSVQHLIAKIGHHHLREQGANGHCRSVELGKARRVERYAKERVEEKTAREKERAGRVDETGRPRPQGARGQEAESQAARQAIAARPVSICLLGAPDEGSRCGMKMKTVIAAVWLGLLMWAEPGS